MIPSQQPEVHMSSIIANSPATGPVRGLTEALQLSEAQHAVDANAAEALPADSDRVSNPAGSLADLVPTGGFHPHHGGQTSGTTQARETLGDFFSRKYAEMLSDSGIKLNLQQTAAKMGKAQAN